MSPVAAWDAGAGGAAQGAAAGSAADADGQALRRRRQRLETLCAASIRALTGDASLQFRSGRLHQGERRLPDFAPHLHPADADDVRSFRGAADGLALRLLLSDAALHRRLRPGGPLERWVFELLEQLRVESLAPAQLPGMTANLRHRFEQWSEAFRASGLCETAAGLLLFTVAQVCRSRLTGEPPAPSAEEIIEATRAGIAPVIGPALAGLRRDRADQAACAAHALAIACVVAQALGREASAGSLFGGPPVAAQAGGVSFSLWIDLDGELDGYGDGSMQSSGGAGASTGPGADDAYRVFTRAYDRELTAAALVRPQRLREHRARLDRLQGECGLNPARVSRLLGAALLRADQRVAEDGREEGLVDGRRIAALVSSPEERRLFRWHRREPGADCVLSVLIDCSGSMKPHRETVACFADLLLRALDAIGVGTELLGFTTGAWNGGRALRDWRRAGRPAAPGRLAECDHLVFKEASQAWRRARTQAAALLEPVFYREGVDGEAVEWACARLAACDARRRVLLVVSDGSPMESASAAANPPGLLSAHLRAAVSAQRRRGAVGILGVGVGLDLSSWYDRSLLLDPTAPLAMADFAALARLLARGS